MTSSKSTVYLVPSVLHETATETIPAYVLTAIKDCQVFFVEDDRTTRRYFKSLWKEMVIDNYKWVVIDKPEPTLVAFRACLKEGKNIGIVSEAGCPGVADPGQILVDAAHVAGAIVKPLAGPSAILMALMASGMNGQQFQFLGYLPIESGLRIKAIREAETESARKNCTQIFIETPYRNNQMMETLVKILRPGTLLSVAADITAPTEYIHTKTVGDWKKELPDLHKKPAIFSLLAS